MRMLLWIRYKPLKVRCYRNKYPTGKIILTSPFMFIDIGFYKNEENIKTLSYIFKNR